VATAASAHGQNNNNNNNEECRKKIRLTSTGVVADASGNAEVRARGTRQKLKVEGEARVADGTTWSVHVNGTLVGAITVAFGEAELELDTGDGQVIPAGVAPVCSPPVRVSRSPAAVSAPTRACRSKASNSPPHVSSMPGSSKPSSPPPPK